MIEEQLMSEAKVSPVVALLSVSPLRDDHISLQAVFHDSKWQLHQSDSLASALSVIREGDIGVVLCERDLSPGTWIDMLQELRHLRMAPALIVTSRLADERLWAEALNLGAYDVLAKPFERNELVRSVSLAWWHWRQQQQIPGKLMKVTHAAS